MNSLLSADPDDPSLVGTSWRRRRRKRRQLRVEKVLYSPRDCDGEDGGVKGGEEALGESHKVSSNSDGEGEGDGDDGVESGSGDSGEGGDGGEGGEGGGGEDEGGDLEESNALEVGENRAVSQRSSEGGGDVVGQSNTSQKTFTAVSKGDNTTSVVARQPAVYVPLHRNPEMQVSEFEYAHTTHCVCVVHITHQI